MVKIISHAPHRNNVKTTPCTFPRIFKPSGGEAQGHPIDLVPLHTYTHSVG